MVSKNSMTGNPETETKQFVGVWTGNCSFESDKDFISQLKKIYGEKFK